MAEIKVGEHTYTIGKLTPYQQLHVARRLLPLFIGASSSITEGQTDDLEWAAPFVSAISKMPDDEVDAIINPCLSVVSRKSGEMWAPVMPKPGQMMFQDISIVDMMSLVGAVLQENIGNFFQGRLGKQR